jgi:hypothetical protein
LEDAVVAIEDIDERLGGEQVELAQVGGVELRPRGTPEDGFPFFQDLLGLLVRLELGGVALLDLDLLLEARDRVLQGLQVGQDQLGVDRLHVGGGVDLSVHVDDVGIVEGPHDLRDRVRLTDIREELVAQPLAFRGTLHDSRDVHEGHGRRKDPLGGEDLGETLEPRVRQIHHTHVRLDGRERVVRRDDGAAGQCIEEGRLAHVGQPHDSDS